MSQSCTIFGDPIGKPRMNNGRFKPVHGMRNSRIYLTWNSMLNRCRNPRVRSYKSYGGRGIIVCERWLTFAQFLRDMGPQPDGLWLDRIDSNGPYDLGNCRWASRTEQANNKRNNVCITWNNVTKSIADWAREIGIPRDTLSKRIQKYNWPINRAMTIPVRLCK